METLVQANIFFFITSIAVLVISFFLVVLLIKLRRLVSSVNTLVEKLKNTSDFMGEEAKDLIDDIKQSPIFRFMFPRRKKRATSDIIKTTPPKLRRKV